MGKLINPIINKYTAVPNSVFRDKNLDYKCRGLLGTLISLPDGWNFSVRGLAALTKGDGVDSTNAALQKLERLGYLERILIQGEKGKFLGYDYKIIIPPKEVGEAAPYTENPYTDKPYTENPYTDKPYTDKPPQYISSYIFISLITQKGEIL